MIQLRTTKLFILVALPAALAVALAACGGGGETSEVLPATQPNVDATAGQTQAPAGELLTPEDILRKDGAATKQAEIEWGWMFEESGPLQGFGEPAGDGVLLAVEEINEAGGFQVGDTVYTIKLLKHNTESEVDAAIAAATGLIRDDHVKVIWGPAATGDPETTQLTQSQEVLHLCPCPNREITTLRSIEQASEESRWAFQTLPAASKFLPRGARDTARDYPQYKTFVTICANSQTGRAFCDFFRDAYEAAGFEHVGQELIPQETTDFSPFLTRLRGSDPDIVLNFLDAGVAQFSLLQQSWQLDIGEFYISVAVPYNIFEALVGEGIRDKIVAVGAAPRTHAQYTSEEARTYFEEKYKQFRGGGDLPPAAFASLLTYDPVYMLVAAMQRAGTVDDTSAIADALRQVRFDGAGEDEMFFNRRNIIVSGNDSCIVTGGQYQPCVHHPAPAEAIE